MNEQKTGIIGTLHKTGRKVCPVRTGVRVIYQDDVGQLWVKISGKFWRFPDEIDY